ncbi:MAG TPA: cysteine desulfurase family protein [Ilumatobacter sp.]|nr:cysteine desulfurase family protein [Ilumatobacter sp.]
MSLAYLDHAATSPMRPGAVAAMLPFLTERYANPEGSHRFARDARRAVDEARDQVADVLGVAPGEVVFTGGGTEGDNTAIAGAGLGRGTVVVTPAAEHHAVLDAVQRTEGRVVPVTATGHVDLDALADALAPRPSGELVRLVSVMAVNNEVGTMTDLAAVSALVRRLAPQAVLHTDAVQAACWIDLRALTPLVDLLSLSAHKFGGPKGAGVLTVRSGTPLRALLAGGGQERERRSGTHNVGGIVATATALAEADAARPVECARVAQLKDRLLDGLTALGGVTETVPRPAAVPGIAHVCFDGVESEALLYLLDEADVCASAASACASGAMEPSHVLAAMGVPAARAAGALRLSFGHTSAEGDVDRTLDAIADAVSRLRRPVGVSR